MHATSLQFERQAHESRGQCFTVSFHRGGCIACSTAEQAQVVTARHLERARRNRVHDQVVEARWHTPASAA